MKESIKSIGALKNAKHAIDLLSNHYQRVYGMKPTGVYLVTEGRNTLDLIERYYEDKTD